MQAKIDTIQIETLRSNIKDFEELSDKPFLKEGCTTIRINNKTEHVSAVLHPSRDEGRYNSHPETYTYSYYKTKKQKMLNDLTVKVIDDVKVKRIDVCFDLKENFKDLYPMLELIAFCYCLEYKTRNAWENKNLFDHEVKAIMNKARHNDLCIYNKQDESKGLHPYNTRIEFRTKDIAATEDKKIKDLSNLLNRLYGNLKAVEGVKIDTLYKKYSNELANGTIKDFTEFVRHNSEHFGTRNVLEQVYKKAGMQGDFANWLRYYKKNNKITLYSNTQVKAFINQMKRSLKAYKNN